MRTTYSQDQITKTEAIAGLIGDHSNILIIYELMNFGDKSFNELKRMTGINAVTLSRKLACLRQEGIVNFTKVGLENRYFLTNEAEKFRPLIKEVEKLVIN